MHGLQPAVPTNLAACSGADAKAMALAFCGGVGQGGRANSRPAGQQPPQQLQQHGVRGSPGNLLKQAAPSSSTALLSTAAIVGGVVMSLRSPRSVHAAATGSSPGHGTRRCNRVIARATKQTSDKLRQEEDRLLRNMEDLMEKEEVVDEAITPVLEPVQAAGPRYNDVRQVLPRALPFLPEPEYRAFASNVAGDAGFDPLNLCTDVTKFVEYREAELKHGRLAMLVAVAWPVAELGDAAAVEAGLPDILADTGGRFLPQLTGGTEDKFVEFFLALVIAIGSIFELIGRPEGAAPGDVGFDPLKLRTWNPAPIAGLLPAQRAWMDEAELKHSRFAMSVVLYDILDEVLTGNPVIEDTEFFFHRIDAKFFRPEYWSFQIENIDMDAATDLVA